MKAADMFYAKTGECDLAYPGEYHPPDYDWGKLMKELRQTRKKAGKSLATVEEYADHYKVEIAAPGHQKEDFFVTIHRNTLHVIVFRSRPGRKERTITPSGEFSFECFEELVELPENIDTDFIRAEYKAGMLCICFPKADNPVLSASHPVIVY